MKSATINITYQGLSANYLTPLPKNASDAMIRRVCEEAIRGGEVPELPRAIPANAFAAHVVDRFQGAKNQFIVRPQVPFG